MPLSTLLSWVSVSEKAVAAAKRFPASLAAILALTVLMQFDKIDLPWASWNAWMLGLGCAVPLSMLPVLLAEARPGVLPAAVRPSLPWLAAIGGVALGVIELPTVSMALALAAANFALLAVPEISSPRGDGAAWLRGVAAAALLSSLAVQIVGCGISLQILTVDALFGTHLASSLMERLWKLAMTLLLPGCTLALWPSGTGAAPAPKWVRGMVDWLFAPLTLAFAAILHVYVLGRAVSGELPKGVIGMSGGVFFVLGGMAWTTAMMLDDAGFLRRLLRRGFLPLLLVPGIGMAVAAVIRIRAYGLTEERYLLLAAAILGILLPGVQLLRRAVPRPTAVMAALAAISLLTAFGPWGAYELPLHDQAHRLNALLQRAAWEDPAASRGLQPASPEDAKTIKSAVQYLVARKREDLIQGAKVPPHHDDKAFPSPRASEIVKAWDLQSPAQRAFPEFLSTWTSAHHPAIPVTGYDSMFRIEFFYRQPRNASTVDAVVTPEDVIVVTTPDKRSFKFNMADLLPRLPPDGSAPVVLDAAGEDAPRARMVFTQISQMRLAAGEPPRSNNINAYLLVKTP